MGKKKKMTPAQAAAARRDDTRKRTHTPSTIKDSGPKDRGLSFVWGVTIVLIAAVVVISLLFTVGPFNGMIGS